MSNFISRLRESAAKRKRLEEAAEQLWYHVSRGANLEVPFHLKKDDELMQAIQIMQRRHPTVNFRLYQSKGLVVGLHKPGETMSVSQMAFDQLMKGGQVGAAGDQTIEQMLAHHEGWLLSQGIDPAMAEREAQEADAKRHAIAVGGTGTAPDAQPSLILGTDAKPLVKSE